MEKSFKKYQSPEVEIIKLLSKEDIVTASTDPAVDDIFGDDFGN